MIPLYKPYMPEVPLVNEILHSGKLTYGEYGRAFENELRNFFGVQNLIVTNTFSNAIMVAVSTLGLVPGDKVIASPMACLASTQPLIALGLKVVWADVDPQRGTLDPDSVKEVIKKNADTKLIIHNHFCGYPGHIDEINELGREFGIPVMDDGIEAFGSEYKGYKIGNVGSDITVFSFGAARIPNTIDGGAVIFKSEELYLKSLFVRDLGIDRSNFRDSLGEINSNCDINLIGHNATPSEIQSYIGNQQIKKAPELISINRSNALKWEEILESQLDLKLITCRLSNPNYWVFGVLSQNKKKSIIHFRSKGLFASGVHINNNAYSIFGKQKILLGVEKFNNSFFALPCGWWFHLAN